MTSLCTQPAHVGHRLELVHPRHRLLIAIPLRVIPVVRLLAASLLLPGPSIRSPVVAVGIAVALDEGAELSVGHLGLANPVVREGERMLGLLIASGEWISTTN